MHTELISIEEFCTHHHTEVTFIDALEENGLIQVVQTESLRCIHFDQLSKLEQYIRLHQELDLNIEGIEVVNQLLGKLESMQHKLQDMEMQLRFYR